MVYQMVIVKISFIWEYVIVYYYYKFNCFILWEIQRLYYYYLNFGTYKFDYFIIPKVNFMNYRYYYFIINFYFILIGFMKKIFPNFKTLKHYYYYC